MMFFSHIAFSFVFSKFFDFEPALLLLGSIFPDIDNTNSVLGKSMPDVSAYLNNKFGHRGMLHSLLIPITIIAVCFAVQNQINLKVISFAFGITSHLFLDMFSNAGVKILYPLEKKFSFFQKGLDSNFDLLLSLLFLVYILFF